jgi:hypothetical protein
MCQIQKKVPAPQKHNIANVNNLRAARKVVERMGSESTPFSPQEATPPITGTWSAVSDLGLLVAVKAPGRK